MNTRGRAMTDVKGLCEHLLKLASFDFCRRYFSETDRKALREAATALQSLAKELAEARTECETVCNSYVVENQQLSDRALAAEAASASKDERIRELEAELEGDEPPEWKGHEIVDELLGLQERYLRNLCLSAWGKADQRAWHRAEAEEMLEAYQARLSNLQGAIALSTGGNADDR